MKKSLILVNWGKRESNVLNTLAREMCKHFDRVIIIGRDVPNIYRNVQDLPVEVKPVSRLAWLISLLKSPLYIGRREVWHEIGLAHKIRKLGGRYFIQLAKSVIVGEILHFSCAQAIRKNQRGTKWTILSLWFDARAYGVALTKRTFPKVPVATLAHSFEIDPEKNPYYLLGFKHYSAGQLNLTAFISDSVKNAYIQEARNYYALPLERIKTFYLGSHKCGDTQARLSQDGIFRIVTCSGVSSVKRLDLLAAALLCWAGKPIQWTHLGSGPLFGELQEYVRRLNASPAPVTANLLGWVEHYEIFNYYDNHCVDLFINVSAAEGLPVSIMEAISYGIPILATNVGGNSEIVTSANGLLLPADPSPGEICEAISTMVEMPLAQRKELRAASFDLWRKHFDVSKTMEKLARALLSLDA